MLGFSPISAAPVSWVGSFVTSASAIAAGATLTGTSTLAIGNATGDVGSVNATAPGVTLSGSSSIQAGSASNGIYARALSGNGPTVIQPGSTRPRQSATSRPSNTGGRRY